MPSKPQLQTLEYYDYGDVRDYLNDVEPSLGDKWWDHACRNGIGNDSYHNVYMSADTRWPNKNDEMVLKVGKALGYCDENATSVEIEMAIWVCW